MRSEKRTGGLLARKVLLALATDARVLSAVAPNWDGKGFGSRWENLVAGWCVKHWQKYGKPVGRDIGGYYDRWCERNKDAELQDAVARLVEAVSKEGKSKASSEFMIDAAKDILTKSNLERMWDEGRTLLERGEVTAAVELVEKFRRVEVGTGSALSLFKGGPAVRNAFRNVAEVLIDWPQPAMKQFFGPIFSRGEFVCFMAGEKMGKCLSGDAEVVQANGNIRTVREICQSKDQTPVLAMCEETRKLKAIAPVAFYDNGVRQCVRVTTRTGRSVETTTNHKYLTPSGWRELSELRPGSYIAVPRKMPTAFGRSDMQPSLIRFLAYMIAEGCCVVTRNKKGYSSNACTFTNADPKTRTDFEYCCRQLGVQLKERGISYNLSGPARQILSAWGVLGHSAKTKTIPSEILAAGKSQIAMFLRALFTCDGYICMARNPTLGICLANEVLIRQVSHLLNRFGVTHRVSYKVSKYNGKDFDSWRITVSGVRAVNAFLKEINFDSYKETNPLPENGPWKSFLDKLPPQEAARFLERLQEESEDCKVPATLGDGKGKYVRAGHALRTQLGGAGKVKSIRDQIRKGQPVMMQSFRAVEQSSAFAFYYESDLMWDEIEEMEFVGAKDTYDIAIPEHHNFVANDIVVHNSFDLMEVAVEGVKQENNVAFFEVGDQTRPQIIRRFAARVAGRPAKEDKGYWFPTAIEHGEPGEPPTVTREKRVARKAMTDKEADEAVKKFGKKYGNDSLRLSVHPNSSVNVLQIDHAIQEWKRDGWVPDIVVIDYADILAPLDGRAETRDQINATWKALRGLGQKLDCCMVTATQADAASYKAHTLSRTNFSEDKRKYAHVTAMLGINRTETEYNDGLARLNFILARDLEFSSEKCLYVAPCHAVANPWLYSSF